MEYLGAWGTLIHEKNRSRKSRVRLPIKMVGVLIALFANITKQKYWSPVFYRNQSPLDITHTVHRRPLSTSLRCFLMHCNSFIPPPLSFLWVLYGKPILWSPPRGFCAELGPSTQPITNLSQQQKSKASFQPCFFLVYLLYQDSFPPWF